MNTYHVCIHMCLSYKHIFICLMFNEVCTILNDFYKIIAIMFVTRSEELECPYLMTISNIIYQRTNRICVAIGSGLIRL